MRFSRALVFFFIIFLVIGCHINFTHLRSSSGSRDLGVASKGFSNSGERLPVRIEWENWDSIPYSEDDRQDPSYLKSNEAFLREVWKEVFLTNQWEESEQSPLKIRVISILPDKKPRSNTQALWLLTLGLFPRVETKTFSYRIEFYAGDQKLEQKEYEMFRSSVYGWISIPLNIVFSGFFDSLDAASTLGQIPNPTLNTFRLPISKQIRDDFSEEKIRKLLPKNWREIPLEKSAPNPAGQPESETAPKGNLQVL
jgi:hypothetical protein